MNSKSRENDVSSIFLCSLCGQSFCNKQNINRHMKNVHEDPSSIRKCRGGGNLRCPIPLCQSTDISSYQELETHCRVNHDEELTYESLQFSSFNGFLEWKQAFEKDTQSYFILSRSLKRNRKKDLYYVCHRSGTYKPNLQENKRMRQLKLKGTNKINGTCPARVIASQFESGEVKVKLVITHLGHDCEVGTLRLAKSERDTIAGKLLQGIQSERILKDIGSQFDSKLRVSYTTNKDINNIKKSYNVHSDVIFHSDDAQSVNILVKQFQELQETPILAYKPYGVEDPEGVIDKDNFFLLFMNKAQQEMLNKYGNDILMIDSTHGTNSYKIQLSTLMVLDDAYEGFPVAFLWSITQTENIYQHFFSCLKEKVPAMKPAIFMSDDCNAFYNAFVKNYGYTPKKLLCDWHVKRNLSDNLSKIPQKEKKNEVKKKMYALINELDEVTFIRLLQSFIEQLNSDLDTKNYCQYFTSYYANRTEQWAHCFRKGLHRNTNMTLEKWHQEIKHNNSVKGKCQQRLDMSINNIIECLRMKFMKRLVSMSRSKVPHKLRALRRRHKVAEELLNQNSIEVIEQTHCQWLIPSSKNDNTLLEYYLVNILDKSGHCNCSFLCNDCNMCLHGMSCTCHDYLIQFNMCKHIHVICQMIIIKNTSHSGPKNPENNNEQSAISTHLSQVSQTNQLEYERKLAVDKVNFLLEVVNKITNIDSILYASKNIASVIAGVHALESQTKHCLIPESEGRIPHNKKAKHQIRRVPSLKKKTKIRKTSKSDNIDNENTTALKMLLDEK